MTEFENLSLTYMWWQNIIAAGGFLLTIISIFAVYGDYSHRKKKESAEKAIEIAKYFMDEILPGLSKINNEYKKANITLLNKYKFYEYEDFDQEELNTLFTKKEIDEVKDKINSIKIVFEISESEKKEIPLVSFSFLMLNRLEYMCMALTSEVADEDYIYDSLHQIFLSSVQTLYVIISNLNINEKDKRYINIINIFNIWKNKNLKELKKEERINKKIETRIKKIKKKFKKTKKIN